MPYRRDFLRTLGASAASPLLLAAGGYADQPAAGRQALVLSGGGALGAYQAGAIGCFTAGAGFNDGHPLDPYDIVVGTSIGALNGWFVATAQYSKLHELWYGASAMNIMQLKPQFAATQDPQSGAADKLFAKIRMASLTSDQTAMYDSGPVLNWISKLIDPQRPLVMPFIWAVTNLTRHRTEFFFRRPQNAPVHVAADIVKAIKLILGPDTVVREASTENFHKEIFASAAIPIVWDPVLLTSPEGTLDQYCDGGVASNSSVRISHAMAEAVDVILLNPPFEADPHYENAITVAFGMFGTMQAKILSVDMRNVHFQSVAKQAFAKLPGADAAIALQGDPELAAYFASLPATRLRYMRPKEKLPVGGGSFSDQEGIGKAYRIGWNDAITGFMPYDWKTFDA